MDTPTFHGTTILSACAATRHRPRSAATARSTLGQHRRQGFSARKVRKLHHEPACWQAFAGADPPMPSRCSNASRPSSRSTKGICCVRAAIELTKDWRTDRVLRRLEAMLAVADKDAFADRHGQRRRARTRALGIVSIGSGGAYAQAAARALLEHSALRWRRRTSSSGPLEIAGDLCIYTNQNAHDRDPGMSSSMTPKEIVLRARPPHRRPAPTPSARWPSRCATAGGRQQVDDKLRGGDHAEEHTDDRAHWRGQDRDRAPPCASWPTRPSSRSRRPSFTEVGYVGKDVDSIVRDLVDMASSRSAKRR